MRKTRIALLLISLLCASSAACGRRRLQPDGIERNQLYAEIIKRADRRILGDDGFFPTHLLDSSQPQVQEWCALALGRIGNPRALPWLYEAFRSPYAPVRAAAAFAVGMTEDRDLLRSEGGTADARAAAELQTLLDDSAIAVRMRAVEALGKIGQDADALEIIKRLASFDYDGTPERRAYLASAITALMRMKNLAARPALERLAGINEPEIQWRVANAFYRIRDKDARPVLERLLQSSDSDVRAHAARALGICGDPGLATLLEPLLQPVDQRTGSAQPLSVRACALQALANLKNPRAVPAIENALWAAPINEANLDQMNFAVQAAAALGNIGSQEGTGALQRLALMGGPVADSAVFALAKLLRDDPERFFILVSGARFDTAAGLRAWAQALGELGGPRAQSELKMMLVHAADAQPGTPAALAVPSVLQALARAQAPDLHQILETYLTMHDGVVLRAAAAAYQPAASIAAPWKPILQAYAGIASGADAETKVALLDRLGSWIHAPEVESFLRSALQDRERNARIAAARLLRSAGHTDVPVDPGPSDTNATDLTYIQLASARQDRTIAIMDTARGRIEIELFREDAPLTVANFVSLAERGFFDGLSFMRVVPYFVIQGGDPRNDQEGGPGYTIRCEINMHPFERGAVGMALAGKDTGGSQFFITLSPQPHLDGGYTCFGRVISGMPAAEHMLAGDRIVRVRVKEEVTLFDYRRY
jgi:cyclophilin family peptidyl-prolyl cis-trans isomerase/HEAT repeat protein